jgi:hypothetical protein
LASLKGVGCGCSSEELLGLEDKYNLFDNIIWLRAAAVMLWIDAGLGAGSLCCTSTPIPALLAGASHDSKQHDRANSQEEWR